MWYGPSSKQPPLAHRCLDARPTRLCHNEALCTSHARLTHRCSPDPWHSQKWSSGPSFLLNCQPHVRWAALNELNGGAEVRSNFVLRVAGCCCWVLAAVVCRWLVHDFVSGLSSKVLKVVDPGTGARAGAKTSAVRARAWRSWRIVNLD